MWACNQIGVLNGPFPLSGGRLGWGYEEAYEVMSDKNNETRIPPVAKQRSRALRGDSTLAERKLWKYLRDKQLDGNRFRRQHPVGKFIVDVVCIERGLIVELDGGQHAEQAQCDAQRTAWLESQGFKVLRFWNNEVLNNIEGVVQKITSALGRTLLPPSQPSPTFWQMRGEGAGSAHLADFVHQGKED